MSVPLIPVVPGRVALDGVVPVRWVVAIMAVPTDVFILATFMHPCFMRGGATSTFI